MNKTWFSAAARLVPLTLVASLAVPAVMGCGSDSGASGAAGGSNGAGGTGGTTTTCPGPQTCGGNIVGTWNSRSSCVSADPTFGMTMDCPTAKADVSKLSFTGSVIFTADGTETSTTTLSGSMSVTIPNSCLTTPQGVVVSCDLLSQAEAADLDTTGPFASISCKAGGGGCICTLLAKGTPSTSTGPYTTSGGTLNDTNSDGEPSMSSYCVSGETLSLYNDMDGLRLSATLTKQ